MRDPERQAQHLQRTRAAAVAERERPSPTRTDVKPAEIERRAKDRGVTVKPVTGVREPGVGWRAFRWPRFHAFLLRTRRLLLGLVIANMVLAVLGMAILGPWGFIPAAPLVVLVPLFMVATDLDRRATGAGSNEELEQMTDEEAVQRPEERSTGTVIADAIEREDSYTPGESRKIAIGLVLFAGAMAIVAFVGGLVFGRPLLGFGALFIFGYVALLGTVIGFASMHEMYEEEHGLQDKQYKKQ